MIKIERLNVRSMDFYFFYLIKINKHLDRHTHVIYDECGYVWQTMYVRQSV